MSKISFSIFRALATDISRQKRHLAAYLGKPHCASAPAYAGPKMRGPECPTTIPAAATAPATAANSCSSSYLLFPFRIDYILLVACHLIITLSRSSAADGVLGF